MSSSFDKINYSLRPAKHTERRMLSEVFRRLWPFQMVSDYVYVGFGAVAFSDFVLFHRTLGMREMISIERETDGIARVRENAPFNIKIDNRSSAEALPDLPWDKHHILWLDYDDALSPDMLADAKIVASRAVSGSVVAVSFNCHRASEIAEANGTDELDAVDLFRDRFGRERVPEDVGEDDLYGWPFASLGRRLILTEIEAALALRNIEAEPADVVSFHRICEIEYKDGARMTTLVGIFVAERDADKLFSCKFDSLDFLEKEQKPIRISVPLLTVKEIRSLESQLPLNAGIPLECGQVPPGDAKHFVDLYRYLPNFAVLEA
ncbi:hypothetical protein JQ600_18370 [Bradyrhizobium sp. AUGA SZCCT0176]|uniref:O-methyltransferase n=1 Tax=Bradyrhizobium sp. AUGA SZCCT0176 TaxID=2807664 RepID=UPI001BA4F91D|nr:O-methyltransferase [Bradyrhizobium sp. AUGA SZCCT0176]MBR1226897.1 hypothetical protein [Bradyrhizobium sp. AUGA SZCCT0176]